MARQSAKLVAILIGGGLMAGPASAVEKVRSKPYVPVAVEVAKAVTPAPDLLTFAKSLRAAAAAKDVEAVAAMIADEVTVVSSAIDLGTPKSMKKEGPVTDPAALVRIVGNNSGGDWDLPKGVSAAEADKIVFGFAFSHIVEAIDGAEWGRDPLVKGGFCTYRARSWNAEAVKKQAMDGGGIGGGTVAKPTPVKAKPVVSAGVVETLQPGRLYLSADAVEAPDGWHVVRLPGGGVGYLGGGRLDAPTRSGICFLPNVDGGWLMSAVAGVGL